MSKILDSAKAFQTKSKEELQIIEKEAKNDLEQFRQRIKEALKQSEHSIYSDIQQQQSKLRVLISKPYKIAVMVILSILGVLIAASLFLGWKISSQVKEIEKLDYTFQNLTQKTGGIQTRNCVLENGQKKLCVKIDPTEKSMYVKSENAEYRIIAR